MDIGSVNRVGNFANSQVEAGTTKTRKDELERVETKQVEQAQPVKAHTKEEVEKAVEELNKSLQKDGTHLKFTMHEKLGEYFVQIVSDHTNEVVREIPSKKILDMVAEVEQKLGLIIDVKR